MNVAFIRKNMFWLFLVLGLVFLTIQTGAQEAEETFDDTGEETVEEAPVDPNAWKKEREAIFREIRAEADKQARKNVTKEKIVAVINGFATKYENDVRKEENRIRKMFIAREQRKWRDMEDMPDTYPDMSKYLNINIPIWTVNTKIEKDVLKIKDEMEKDLTSIFEKACPPKSFEDLEAEGQKKYPMYRLIDGQRKPTVENIILRGGRGYAAKVSGRLENITVSRLQIGNRLIRREDLDEDTQALFYDDVNDKMVEKYIQQEIRRYKAIKEGFVAEWISMTYPDTLMANGYVPKLYLVDKMQRHSTGTQNWIQRNVYLDTLYRTRLKKEIERLTPAITADFFENAAEKFNYEYNYEFVKEAGDPPGTGEWMPTNVAEAFRMQKEAQAAAAANGGQNGDMPPPDAPPPM